VRVVRYRSIHRLFCDADLVARAGLGGVSIPEGTGTMLRGEAQGGRARKKRVRRGGGEGREEGTQGLLRPGRFERAGRAGRPGKPQERCGDEATLARGKLFGSLAWIRAEQTVEGVRNPEDGRCRRSW